MPAREVSYKKWNLAIAEVVFPERPLPEPVYLDLEDEELAALGEVVGIPPSSVEEALCRDVAASLDLRRPAEAFSRHERALARWSRGDRDKTGPPPVLALLAVFSLAAERMAAADGLVSHNFYGRLRECLGLAPDVKEIEDAYRGVAETFWGALNRWLTELDGLRGTPTAYAISHRYVGLSVSQALIRKTDRDRLITFFQTYGLAPGMEVPPAALDPLLNSWITRTPSPASKHLQRLWATAAARERVSDTVALALASWDGSVRQRAGADGGTARINLSAEIGGFPKKRFRLQALMYAARPDVERLARLQSTEGEALVPLVPTSAGALALGGTSEFNAASLLEGTLTLVDTHTGMHATRKPRRLVVFRQDDLTRRWIETEGVLLGADVTLLARSDLSEKLKPILDASARPGWTATANTLPGLPENWLLFRGVQLFRHPGERAEKTPDLAPLVPLTTSQMELAGGLRLPSSRRNVWHTSAPPELRAVSDTPGGFTVTLVDLGPPGSRDEDGDLTGDILEHWSDAGTGTVVVSIADAELEDGDYRLDLTRVSDGSALAVRNFALRTADNPDPRQWERAPTVAQHLADSLSIVSAGSPVDGPVLRGALVATGGNAPLHSTALPQSPWWSTQRSSPPSSFAGVRIPRAEPESCLYTGRHRIEIESAAHDARGRPTQQTVTGHCSQCGLEKRYSTNYYKNRRKHSGQTRTAPQHIDVDVSRLPSTRQDNGRAWDPAFDALQFVGGGTFSAFEHIARQIESTGLFVDQFLRSLESLGHVEPQRDARTLAPLHWEVAPTELVATRNGYLLLGYWPLLLRKALAETLAQSGGTLEGMAQPDGDGPLSWFARGADLAEVAHSVDEGISVLDDGWRSLACELPTLGDLLRALPRRSADVTGHLKRFSVPEARWVDTGSLSDAGAYRLANFSTLDLVRTEEDVSHGEMAVSLVQLSKHAAALIEGGLPLVTYNPATEELSVPLGADLPGLYGRAAVLSSGLLPTARGRLLTYHQVPRDLAAHLAYLLTR